MKLFNFKKKKGEQVSTENEVLAKETKQNSDAQKTEPKSSTKDEINKYEDKLLEIKKMDSSVYWKIHSIRDDKERAIKAAKESQGLDNGLLVLKSAWLSDLEKIAIETYPLDTALNSYGFVDRSDPKYREISEACEQQLKQRYDEYVELGNDLIDKGEQSNLYNKKLVDEFMEFSTGGKLGDYICTVCESIVSFAGAISFPDLDSKWYDHYKDQKFEKFAEKVNKRDIVRYTNGTISDNLCIWKETAKLHPILQEVRDKKLDAASKSQELRDQKEREESRKKESSREK